MQQLFDKLAHPAMTNLALTNTNGESLDFWPSPLPDLYFAEPIMVAIKLDTTDTITFTGQTAHGEFKVKLNPQASSKATGIDKLWARQKIKSLLLYIFGSIQLKTQLQVRRLKKKLKKYEPTDANKPADKPAIEKQA